MARFHVVLSHDCRLPIVYAPPHVNHSSRNWLYAAVWTLLFHNAYGSKSGFQKAFWKLESKLSEENKELAAATLRSIALNYVK